MTDSRSGAVPPGWYADPTGQAGVRWWDGTQWTAHSAPTPASGPGAASTGPRPRIADGAPVYTPYIWIIVLLPLVSAVAALIWHPEFRATTIRGVPTVDPGSIYTPGYWIVQLLGLVIFALNVVFAALDHGALRRAGVVRPFHWGFAFLGVVYPIGRSVIVHQVAKPRGLVPLWVLIGTYVVSFVIGGIVVVQAMSQLTSQLSQLSY